MTANSEDWSLPAEVRQRLLAIASELVGNAPLPELPPSIRRFARFAPAQRLRLAAAEIATALATDEGFREAVAELVIEAMPELTEQVRAGRSPAAADPVEVAVLLYLLRPPDWQAPLAEITEALSARHRRRASEAELGRLRAEVSRLSAANAELGRLREAARTSVREATAEQAEQSGQLRSRLRALQAELREARRAEHDCARQLTELRAEHERAVAADSAELRKARARISALEAEVETGRRSSRTDRDHDDARLWVLLETITAAAAGLRRELDVTKPIVRPAELVAGNQPGSGSRPSNVDGSLLDRLLDGSHVHLIVDGYNVTKTGYPALPLADQRARLVSSLGALAARTGVEITVAFDGTAAPVGAAASVATPRGVRVLFSSQGQLADDLIRDLLSAEPAGRTVLVASSDKAVAASVRAAGGWPTPAVVLLSRLERG